jgi:hypothetical protein
LRDLASFFCCFLIKYEIPELFVGSDSFVLPCIWPEGEKPQKELLSNIKEWLEGSILLTDNSEISGMVKYNDREGMLSYYDGENTRVFGPLSVCRNDSLREGK